MNNLKIKNFKDISDVVVPEEFIKIWEDVSLGVQENKARGHNLSEATAQKCFAELCKRPYYLVEIAKAVGAKNFAEVGTAQGLQYFSFAELAKSSDGHVWSCDIVDSRNKDYIKKYSKQTTFCSGDSRALAKMILKSGEKIDMFYIDGAHDHGDVVRDVISLRECQSDNPVWVFDDYDERFGCYRDITRLIEDKPDVKIYRVGNAASGNPNHQVIVRGKY